MGKTYTDFSQLSKGLFRREKPEEVKPLPPKPSANGGEEVLAYFSRPGLNAPKRPANAVCADQLAGRERLLLSELEATRGELAAAKTALAAADEAKADADQRIAGLEAELRNLREEHDASARERDRLRCECGRLAGELRNRAENAPVAAPPQDVPTVAGEPEKPTRGLLDASCGVSEVFGGEVREQVLAALADARDAARQSGRERRAAVLDSVLAANPPSGELGRRRMILKQTLKDAGSFTDAHVLAELERLGIRCISGRKHWKLEYGNVRVPISKTPSDYCSSLNTSTDLANRCF